MVLGIESNLTLEQVLSEPEGLYYDRKSSKIAQKDLANAIAAFANANGGVIAVGISDDGNVEESIEQNKINALQRASLTLSPAPTVNIEMLGNSVMILKIKPALEYIVRNSKGEVYYRQGDSCVKLTAQQVRCLEYERGERNFEIEVVPDATMDDLDKEMVTMYKQKIGSAQTDEEVLRARGFIRDKNGRSYITNAGILLFGKRPAIFLPGARVRVVKFEGNDFGVGKDFNIIKDLTFDQCLYKTIQEVKQFVASQLRDFITLGDDGVFTTVPEYPEFAWLEGVVNAVTHRDYTNAGEHIRISIFDNRLEILSPGKLSGFVTLDNMRNRRYSRNPIIARTLTELGIVRELNEGVKRIYSEMESFYLDSPTFSEPENSSVQLVLTNNILIRGKRNLEHLQKIDGWEELNSLERKAIRAIYDSGGATSSTIAKTIGRSKPTAIKMLEKLSKMGVIAWDGTNKNDKYGKYIMR